MTVGVLDLTAAQLYAEQVRRRDAAMAWRAAHEADPLRDMLWDAYRLGARIALYRPGQAALLAAALRGLNAAEMLAPWSES